MIVTGLDGRALLDRAGDRIEITPGTRLQLEPQATTTSVLQRAGRVIYDIVTGGKPRFDVQTPFLVAGVKGTVFSVTVTTNGASVSVSEGVVGVSPPTPGGFDGADVSAGSSAAVSVDAGSLSITVEDTQPAARPNHCVMVPPRRAGGSVLPRPTVAQIAQQPVDAGLKTGAGMAAISPANKAPPMRASTSLRRMLAATTVATTVAETAATTVVETAATTVAGIPATTVAETAATTVAETAATTGTETAAITGAGTAAITRTETPGTTGTETPAATGTEKGTVRKCAPLSRRLL